MAWTEITRRQYCREGLPDLDLEIGISLEDHAKEFSGALCIEGLRIFGLVDLYVRSKKLHDGLDVVAVPSSGPTIDIGVGDGSGLRCRSGCGYEKNQRRRDNSVFRLALVQGYEVYVIADACDDVSAKAHDRAVDRITQAGARPMTALQYLLELQRDWARTQTYELTTGIAKRFGGAYSLGLVYARAMFAAREGH